jgi:hypothetical protein
VLEREQLIGSRLFAIDAGLDLAALRARYPDATTDAIVRARVRPQWRSPGAPRGGVIEALSADEVNVPLALRPVFDGGVSVTFARSIQNSLHFDATVMFGARSEPWLASAARR